MIDTELLAALLASSDLSERERGAFASMQRRARPLTFNQRAWAQGVAARVGLPELDPGKPHRVADPPAAQGLTPKRIAIVEQEARDLCAELKGER